MEWNTERETTNTQSAVQRAIAFFLVHDSTVFGRTDIDVGIIWYARQNADYRTRNKKSAIKLSVGDQLDVQAVYQGRSAASVD